MKRLADVEINETVTVRKIFGGRSNERLFENMGIMPGSDLKVMDKDDGFIKVAYGNKTAEIALKDAEQIGVGEHFVRNGDPVLLGGCCGGGNCIDLMEKYSCDK